MNRSKKRKTPGYLDVSDLPIISVKKPIRNANTDLTRPNLKLRALMDQGKYQEAKLLFTAMVKSGKFNFKNLWQTGIEIIGNSAPEELTGYLKAVFVSSPVKLSAETFNVYIDQLMIEKKWDEALEEAELRYNMPIYHHPILLRKMSICSYHLWKSAREKLPESYFEEDTHDMYDLNITRYEKHLRSAFKWLGDAHQTYLRDVELLDIYIDFLTILEEDKIKKTVILKSLDAFDKDPEYHLLFLLLKINVDDIYFDSQDYILRLYEFDPYLDASQQGLKKHIRKYYSIIKNIRADPQQSAEEIEKHDKLAARIFRLYVFRVEHGNPERWFLKWIVKLFERAISEEMCDIYYYYNVDKLLVSPYVMEHTTKQQFLFDSSAKIKNYVDNFTAEKEDEAEEISEEEEDEDVIIKQEPLIEKESFMDDDEDPSFMDDGSEIAANEAMVIEEDMKIYENSASEEEEDIKIYQNSASEEEED